MKISKGMIDNYLHFITHDHRLDGVFPEELAEYDGLIDDIEQSLENHKDKESFKLALDYYLCHPEIDLEDVSSPFIMEDDLMRKIITYMKKLIWNEDKVDCERVGNVEIVNTNKFEWWRSRGILKQL